MPNRPYTSLSRKHNQNVTPGARGGSKVVCLSRRSTSSLSNTAAASADLGSASNPLGLTRVYPYDLYAALVDPNITRVKATPTAPANSPRQKDGFILISAGIDRVYGTEDDIANFGNY